MSDERRESAMRGWQAIRQACSEVHAREMKGRAGVAVICVCGQGCGGSAACGMLSAIRSFIRYADADRMRAEDRDWIEMMRAII